MARSFYGRVGASFTDEITGNLEKLPAIVRARVLEAVEAAAETIRERAYDKANVSPGVFGHVVDGSHMRDNLAVVVKETETGVEARIGIDLGIVPYAAHQEFGPHGKPFLRPAIDESRVECHEIMKSVLIDGVEPSTLVRFRRFA